MIRQATGDPAGALEAITEAGQAAPGPAGLLNPVPAQRARLLLAQGDLAAAARFAQENGLRPDDEPDYTRESRHLVLARILLAQDRSGQALALLDAAAKAQGRTGSLIEIGALRALALAATGEDSVAVTVLTEAPLLACPQGYVRVFADQGPRSSLPSSCPPQPRLPRQPAPASRRRKERANQALRLGGSHRSRAISPSQRCSVVASANELVRWTRWQAAAMSSSRAPGMGGPGGAPDRRVSTGPAPPQTIQVGARHSVWGWSRHR